ncbi:MULTISPECIES: Gfo/Idh/MocA family protein [unclassified Arthrobacter]|uniref:Gfo/Idh/MocA family protein n=1 Tax=unclassified Arthrobacter TaxID=235627 RepID=UPI001490EF32|nr:MULTISPECIES: Gfo/Idh/MocA family oxidoreductase [unclassified Arthrobacter]MBE0008295.1 gfo/Idh/MocA family oxidoreductase [Arthrobacter sp. AET 35A]NOJ61566.1 Gfo/Idh/MocA family oxidoreductase [Arthrobacter sp. 260]NOJ62034.1 Gfo/Idh/MocA family oxidoreductase [Arthrobacter sp. 147(2020)]
MTTPAPAAAAEPGTLGVAVLGYSFMGKAHSNAWRNVNAFYPTPRVAQQLLVGRDAGKVAEAATQYGWAESSTDWRGVLERDDIHIVDICTPGHLHAELAIAALQAGKHVLVEKPLANSVAEAEQMVAAAVAARAQGVHSMVGFNYRRLPALSLARSLISGGRVGDVRQIRVSYLQDWLADERAAMSWRLRKASAGSGALGDLASHAVDQVGYLLGDPVVTVSGTVNTFVTERPGPDGPEPVTVDDAAWATLRLASGAVASLEVSRFATGRKNSLQIEVYGSRGGLRFDLEHLNELQYFDSSVPTELQGYSKILVTEPSHPYLGAWWPAGHTLGWDHTFTSQAADFLAAIDSGTPPSPSFEEGLATQRVLAALEESAAQAGTAVTPV